MPFPRDRRRRLRLRRSPRRSHSPGQSRLRVIRSVENGGPQNGPRHRRASKNECDRRNPLEHGGLCSTLSAAMMSLRRKVGTVKYFLLQSIRFVHVGAGPLLPT